MLRLILTLVILYSLTSIKASVYYAINDGNWTTASNWSLTPGGSPASSSPNKGDDIYIGSYHIILDVNLMSEPGISLDIEVGGSLIYTGTEGIYIQAQGFFNVAGYVNIETIDLKNDAVVYVYSQAVLSVTTWSNDGNLVYMHGDLNVSGTFQNSGNITGTGTVTAGHYNNTGTIFCITDNPPDGATVFGNGWIGGTAGVENDWNTPTNWCSGFVPGDSVWVIIESSTSYKEIVITAPSQCRSLTLEPGISLTISASNSLTVVDTIWNHGALTLESTASGSGTLLDNEHLYGAGSYTVELYLADSSSTFFYHHQVCAPVDNQLLQDFDVVHGFTYAYEYHPTTNEWWNIYEESRSIPPMKGILLSTLNSSNFPNTIQFSDAIITGDRSVSVVSNAWNLIGNPYPSPISWDSINPFVGVDNLVYIWNPISKNFVSYVEGTGGNVSCKHIQLGQSFFIYATVATSFQVTNNDRVLNNEPYLKSEQVNYLKIYTSGGNQSSDEVYIRFLEGATTAYDVNLEAEKWPSMSETAVTEIYTVTEDDVDLQINAMPAFDTGEAIVPLHFVTPVSANYTLHTEYMNSFDASIHIYLEDKSFSPSLMYNIREQGKYSFSASPGDPAGRFVLHFSDDASYSIPENHFDQIRIIPGTQKFTIINPDKIDIIEVSLFSITGSEIAQFGPTSASRETYSFHAGHSAYIVRIVTQDRVISRKMINTY